MKFTDVSSERAVRAFRKAGFRIIRDRGNHTVMALGDDIITIPGINASTHSLSKP